MDDITIAYCRIRLGYLPDKAGLLPDKAGLFVFLTIMTIMTVRIRAHHNIAEREKAYYTKEIALCVGDFYREANTTLLRQHSVPSERTMRTLKEVRGAWSEVRDSSCFSI